MRGEGRHPDRVPMREWLRSLPWVAIGEPVRALEKPVRVRAWVGHPCDGWVLIDGEAVAYTAKAGKLEYTDEHGRRGCVWTWVDGIRRIDDDQ